MTLGQLIACGIAPTQARQFVGPLATVCTLFHIDTPLRQAAFVAQCAYESTRFTVLEESLWYRSPERLRAVWPTRFGSLDDAMAYVANPKGLANHVYAGRMGNGDEASGDGWQFHGRGLIQTTGRANYRAAGLAASRPYEVQPELLLTPEDATLSAGVFWNAHKLNALADDSAIDAITLAINGGRGGASDRRQMFEDARRVFAA